MRLESTEGEAQVYMNYLTEEAFTDNAYLATPYSEANSRWTATANASQAATLRVFKEDKDNGNFCYYCVYYVRVVPNSSSRVSYRLSYTSIDDGGDNIEQI